MFFLFVEHLGERALAITNIIRNVSGILFMVTMAFAATCGSLVSNPIGAGEIKCVPERSASTSVSVIFSCCRWLYSSHCFLTWYWASIRIFPIWVRLHPFFMGTMLRLSDTRTCQRLFSGQYPERATHVRRWDWNSVYWPFIWSISPYDSLSESDVAVCWTTEHLYGICILFLSYLYIKKGNWQKSRFDLILLIFALLWKRTQVNSTKPSNT